MMEVTFLGTGSSYGIPMVACKCKVCTSGDPKDKRLRSSVFLKVNDKHIIIDTSPDFRYQMLRENITHIDAVLLTHEHEDHTGGFNDMRTFSFKQQVSIPVYGNQSVVSFLKKNYDYIFRTNANFNTPTVQVNTIENNKFFLKEAHLNCQPIKLQHKDTNPFGFRLGNFSYITDLHAIAPEELNKLYGTSVLILECLQKQVHSAHLHLELAIQIANSIKPRVTYFTHIGHKFGLHSHVNRKLPEGFFLAFDKLKIHI